jgi:pimeloyl-ACP methyl ester carboxylesterase
MAMLDRLPDRVGLVCFDFEGCGNREGEWVTLGVRESREADRVIAFLEARGYVVALWGRSMGAVSALLS